MHVHGLQDGRCVHLHLFDIFHTLFFVLARYHYQSILVDCISCDHSKIGLIHIDISYFTYIFTFLSYKMGKIVMKCLFTEDLANNRDVKIGV